MYGQRLHPKLPDSLKNLFNNPLFRAVVLFLIAYLSSKNFQSSIVITVIFLVTMNILHTTKVLDGFTNYENFSINGPPVASCSAYNNEAINLHGTAFYPLNDNKRVPKNGKASENLLGYNAEIDYHKSVDSITN